ncbi:unnamed protein product [Linum trigynum]|uniref:Uncharacterized protein n=1 Tax=Linum trigynum TaxID=586398 RepID=A0AAV2F6I5_9ROSI
MVLTPLSPKEVQSDQQHMARSRAAGEDNSGKSSSSDKKGSALKARRHLLNVLAGRTVPRRHRARLPYFSDVLNRTEWGGMIGAASEEVANTYTSQIHQKTCEDGETQQNRARSKKPEVGILPSNETDEEQKSVESVVDFEYDSKQNTWDPFLGPQGRCTNQAIRSARTENKTPNFRISSPNSRNSLPESEDFEFSGGGKTPSLGSWLFGHPRSVGRTAFASWELGEMNASNELVREVSKRKALIPKGSPEIRVAPEDGIFALTFHDPIWDNFVYAFECRMLQDLRSNIFKEGGLDMITIRAGSSSD